MIWDLAILLSVLIPTLDAGSGGTKPATSQPAVKEYTQNDFYRESLAFNRGELVDAYNHGGRRNSKWDAAATSALDTFAIYVAQCWTETMAHPPMYPAARCNSEMLDSAAKAALDLGCDDPMVLFAEETSAVSQGRTSVARDALSKAIAGLAGTNYSARLRAQILGEKWRLIDDVPDWPADREALTKDCVEIGSKKYPSAAAERQVSGELWKYLPALSNGKPQEALARFGANLKFDPWILNVLTAKAEVDLGWESRGSQWASDTTPEQMRGFEEHIEKAAAAAQKAYDLRPELPEAATHMITVSMAAGQTDAAKKWFYRALSGQMDYAPAYWEVFEALQPRWGGSVDACMELGKEFADTNRFDTSIPLAYLAAAANVANDGYGGNKDLLKDPQVRETATSILNKYIEQANPPERGDYFRSCLAAVHVVNKEMEPARQLLDQIKGDPSPEAFQMFGLYAQKASDDVYLATLGDKQGFANFKRASSRRFYKNASKFLEEMISHDAPQGRTLEILQRLKDGTDLMVKYGGGKPISLVDETARGFWQSDTRYGISSDGIGILAGDGFSVINRFGLPDRHYDVHMQIEFDDAAAARGQSVNLYWGLNMSLVGWSLALNGGAASVSTQAPVSATQDTDFHTTNVAVLKKNVVDILYAGDVPQVTVNGTTVPMDFGDAAVLKTFKPVNWLEIRADASVHITEMTLHHVSGKP